MPKSEWNKILLLKENKPFIKWLERGGEIYVALLFQGRWYGDLFTNPTEEVSTLIIFETKNDFPTWIFDVFALDGYPCNNLSSAAKMLTDEGFKQDDLAVERYVEYRSKISSSLGEANV